MGQSRFNWCCQASRSCSVSGKHLCFKSDMSSYMEALEGTLQWGDVGEVMEIGNEVRSCYSGPVVHKGRPTQNELQ